MKKTLEKLMIEKKLCALYTNKEEPTRFTVGYILSMDENFILLETVDTHGNYDGFMCRPINEINLVDIDSLYNRGIETMMRHRKSQSRNITFYGDNMIDILMRFIKDTNHICTLCLCHPDGSDIYAYVQEIDDETITLREVNFDGFDDGTLTINKEEIVYICCCSQDEERLEILNQERSK
jgi:hypothetical protein